MRTTVWMGMVCMVGAAAINACGSSGGTASSTEGTSDGGTGGNATTSSSSATGGTMTTSSSSAASSSSSSGATKVNNCDPTTPEDHTTDTTVTINFGGATVGLKYDPPCIKIKTGTAVTFMGAFPSHPLAGGNAGTLDAASPIQETLSGSTATFTFPTAGTFPYYCEDHFSGGMQGAVFVE